MMLDIFSRKDFIIFTTHDFAGHANLTVSAASKQLSRFAEKKLVSKITKGLWANINHPYFSPLSCLPYLLNKEQGYVSFLTALHYHGLISQIPKTIQIATTGHARSLNSPVAHYEFLQLKPELLKHGTVWSESHLPYVLATAEKALCDTLYVATRKKRRFLRLPELTLSADVFDQQKFFQLFKQLPLSTRILNSMQSRAEQLGVIQQSKL